MQTVVRVLMQLLKNTIDGSPLDTKLVATSLADEEFRTVFFRLAKGHDMAHLAALSLQKNGLLPHDEWGDTLQKTAFLAALRYEYRMQEQQRVFELLETEKIPFVPIKGSEIGRYYPEPWWRPSCDLDILIHREDAEHVADLLIERLQYSGKKFNYHDICLYTPNKAMTVELHFSLREADEQIDAGLSDPWQYAAPLVEGGYRYRLSEEYTLFYVVAHAAHHFICGGCGVRPLLDLWILRQRVPYDHAQLQALLATSHLEKFYALTEKLVDRWFGEDEHDDERLMWSAEHYILEGGALGSTANRAILEQVKHGGKAKAIWHQLFLSREHLESYYPVLRKHRWLLPFCQVAHWTRLFNTQSRREARIKFKENQSITEQDKKIAAHFLEELDLHR